MNALVPQALQYAHAWVFLWYRIGGKQCLRHQPSCTYISVVVDDKNHLQGRIQAKGDSVLGRHRKPAIIDGVPLM